MRDLLGGRRHPDTPFPRHTQRRAHSDIVRGWRWPGLRPGGWGAGRIVQGYILLTTEAADLSLSLPFRSHLAQRLAPSPWLEFIWWDGGAQLEDRRASWLHDPLPGASNSVWSRDAARTPPNLDPSCDPEIPDAAWEEKVRRPSTPGRPGLRCRGGAAELGEAGDRGALCPLPGLICQAGQESVAPSCAHAA